MRTNVNPGTYPRMIMIDDECHIIGGSRSRCHYKWDNKLQKIEKIFQFPSDVGDHDYGFYDHGIINLQSQSKLLLFGGYDDDDIDYSDEIWECNYNRDVKDRKWTKLTDVELPYAMGDFGWILTKNEDYVIIFGGNRKLGKIRNILIWDLNMMKFYLSTIKMPNKGQFSAVSMDTKHNMILMCGLIRNVSNEYDMNIPLELANILNEFFESESIYLCQQYTSNGRVFNVELNDILENKMCDISIDYFA